MRELNNEQFKEIKEACLSSYQQGYREGFMDACEQFQQGIKNFIEAADEVFQGKHEEKEKPRPVIANGVKYDSYADYLKSREEKNGNIKA